MTEDDPTVLIDTPTNPQVLVEKTHDFFQVAIEQSGHPGLAKLISDFMEYSMDEFLEFVENKNDETT